MPHPFVAIESRLTAPAATGILLTMVDPGSPAATAGLAAGDLIVAIDGAASPPSRADFYAALRRPAASAPSCRFDVVSPRGDRRTVEVARPFGELSICAVQAGVPAWDATAEDAPEFDASALADGAAIHLRNSLGGTPAGHEVLRLRRRGDLLDVDVRFRLGGDDGRGGAWEYSTSGSATVRLVPGLPAVATRFEEGGRLVGDLRLEGGVWRGERAGPGGAMRPVEFPAKTDVCPAYVATLLPLTMPLRTGARLTWCAAGDGRAVALSRDRFECTGPETVRVDGADVEAWCFAQRHYGLATYGGDERFYVTPDRRLVLVDWGPNYGGCRGESVPPERLNDGVPECARLRK